MKKLIKGVIEFRSHARPGYLTTFAGLAKSQAPAAMLIACSDSRLVPSLFLSSESGEIFIVRNIGNMIPAAGRSDEAGNGASEVAAVMFALGRLPITDIIICGHSDCGAMKGLLQPAAAGEEAIHQWLRHGHDSLALLEKAPPESDRTRHDRLSQLNVLVQLDHLKTYAAVRDRLSAGQLRLHGWWFDIGQADVYAYDDSLRRFVLIDEAWASRSL